MRRRKGKQYVGIRALFYTPVKVVPYPAKKIQLIAASISMSFLILWSIGG
jgi:hypothetical protein